MADCTERKLHLEGQRWGCHLVSSTIFHLIRKENVKMILAEGKRKDMTILKIWSNACSCYLSCFVIKEVLNTDADTLNQGYLTVKNVLCSSLSRGLWRLHVETWRLSSADSSISTQPYFYFSTCFKSSPSLFRILHPVNIQKRLF